MDGRNGYGYIGAIKLPVRSKNTIEYKGIYCPFRWVGEQLQVFYKKSWLDISIMDVRTAKIKA